tara:strand:+ start:337 stop:3018 length:2682 start_codon:yes stop_codon:yes gene_type:complete
MSRIIRSGINSVTEAVNYSSLVIGTQVGELAFVTSSEGTAWLPSTLGGSYYPSGWYVWDGTDWVSNKNATSAELDSIKSDITILQAGGGGGADTQDLSIVGQVLSLTDGGSVTLPDTNTQLSQADIEAFGFSTTDNDTQLSDSDIAAFGYVKTDTQLSDADITALGYVKTDNDTQLSQSDIEAMGFSTVDNDTQRTDAEIQGVIDLNTNGYVTTDNNTQLSDADITALGYIKVDTNTQRTDTEIDARIALNPEGFITSYVDTNTQLTDLEIAAMGYIKTDTQLTDSEITALGYIKTDTNTQRTDSEIDARIALNPEGFITSFTDTNTQLTDADITALGYIKTDTNTQRSDTEIQAVIDLNTNGYITVDTNTQRTDSEIDARISLNPEGFITSFTDTNTQLSDADIAALGYIKVDTNTQLSDAEITALGYIKTDTNTQLSTAEVETIISNNTAGFITTQSDTQDLSLVGQTLSLTDGGSVTLPDTNTQLSDADIAALGYIKVDTNTQLSNAEVETIIATNTAGFITTQSDTQDLSLVGQVLSLTDGGSVTLPDTNTQLSDSDITALGYVKTDTQLTNAEVETIIATNTAGFLTTDNDTQDLSLVGQTLSLTNGGSVTLPDTNTQLSDAEITALGYIKTDNDTQRTDAEINALIDANTNNFISGYTVTESDVTTHEGALTITESQISDLAHFSGSYLDLDDIPTGGGTARTDEEIEDVIGAAISGSGTTSVTYDDAAGTIVVDTPAVSLFQVQDAGSTKQATTTSYATVANVWASPSINFSDFSFTGSTGLLSINTSGYAEFDLKATTRQQGANNRHELYVELFDITNSTSLVFDSQYASRNSTQRIGSAYISGFKVRVTAGQRFEMRVKHVGATASIGDSLIAGSTYFSVKLYK